MNVLQILNTIRAQGSQMYQDRIPEVTQENISEVGSLIIEHQASRNEFVDALVNRIAFTIVSNRRFKNPLAVLKKGNKPFGTDIEEIYVNPVLDSGYDGTESGASDLLTVAKPDVKTIFHRDGRKGKYKVSITVPELQKAFLNVGEMGTFITGVINAMYSGDEIDEYLLMRNVFASAVSKGYMKTVELDYDGEETSSKNLIKLVKTLSGNMTLPSSDYNGYSVLNAEKIASGNVTACVTWTPKENQIILIRTDVDASTDVEVLAKAFNMSKTDFEQRKFVVDSFGDAETLMVLCDDAVPQIRDTFYSVEEFRNGSNLVHTYFLHHWQTISLSLFANGVAIKAKATE